MCSSKQPILWNQQCSCNCQCTLTNAAASTNGVSFSTGGQCRTDTGNQGMPRAVQENWRVVSHNAVVQVPRQSMPLALQTVSRHVYSTRVHVYSCCTRMDVHTHRVPFPVCYFNLPYWDILACQCHHPDPICHAWFGGLPAVRDDCILIDWPSSGLRACLAVINNTEQFCGPISW